MDHDAEFSFSKTTAGRLLININIRDFMSVRAHLLSISVVLEAAGLSLCKGTIFSRLVQTLRLLHVLSMFIFLALKRATCLVTASLLTMDPDRDSSTISPARENKFIRATVQNSREQYHHSVGKTYRTSWPNFQNQTMPYAVIPLSCMTVPSF